MLPVFDHSVLCGHRNEHDQNLMYRLGRSKLQWPHGKHNKFLSEAIDVSPYPYDPDDWNRICYFAGYVMGQAKRMGIKLRWGGDWNMNTVLTDEKFRDLFHFELLET